MSTPRYSNHDFPAYRHVPGKTPHPTRHPDGHSYGIEETVPVFQPEQWRQHAHYLYGIDLHNHGYYWECHEALEGVWRTLDRDAEAALFLQGLIQLSVAHSHTYHRGRPDLGSKLARWAIEKWQGNHYQQYAGIDLGTLRQEVESWEENPRANIIAWHLPGI